MKEKILLSNDIAEAEKSLSELNYNRKKLEKIHEAFCNLVTENKTLTEKEMLSLFSDVQKSDAIKQLIINKHFPAGLNGLSLNSDMLEIPDLKNLIETIKNAGESARTSLLNGQIVIPEGKRVEIAEGAEEAIKQSFMIFIETPEEKKRYDAVLNLCAALNEVNSLLPEEAFLKTNIQFSGNLETIVEVNDSGKFVPNPYFVKVGSAVYACTDYSIRAETVEESKDNKEYLDYIDSMIDNDSIGSDIEE